MLTVPVGDFEGQLPAVCGDSTGRKNYCAHASVISEKRARKVATRKQRKAAPESHPPAPSALAEPPLMSLSSENADFSIESTKISVVFFAVEPAMCGRHVRTPMKRRRPVRSPQMPPTAPGCEWVKNGMFAISHRSKLVTENSVPIV